jgi:hypothetical protein
VYDMYPWNGTSTASTALTASAASARPRIARSAKASRTAKVPPATSAVQVALDRRDNGGDAAAEPAAVLARQ